MPDEWACLADSLAEKCTSCAKHRAGIKKSDDPTETVGKSVPAPPAVLTENYLQGDAGFVSFTRLRKLTASSLQISQHAFQHRAEHGAGSIQLAVLGLAEHQIGRLGCLEAA